MNQVILPTPERAARSPWRRGAEVRLTPFQMERWQSTYEHRVRFTRSAAADAVNEAVRMVNRGGKVCLAAFAHESVVSVDVGHIVRNNIYLYGIRGEGKSATHRAEAYMREKRFDATLIHTHTFPLADLPTALRYAKDRVDDAIKVVVKAKMASMARSITSGRASNSSWLNRLST